MNRLFALRTLCTLLVLGGVTTGALAYKLRSFERYDLKTYYIATRYVPGGETVQQARKRSGAHAVLKGSYFDTASNPLCNIDLTVVDGRMLVGQRDQTSPTLMSVNQETRIVTRKEAIKLCHKVKGAHCLGGVAIPVFPTERRDRHLTVEHNGSLYDLVIDKATQADCEKVLTQKGIASGKVTYFDGGDSLLPHAKMPSHILIMKRSSTKVASARR